VVKVVWKAMLTVPPRDGLKAEYRKIKLEDNQLNREATKVFGDAEAALDGKKVLMLKGRPTNPVVPTAEPENDNPHVHFSNLVTEEDPDEDEDAADEPNDEENQTSMDAYQNESMQTGDGYGGVEGAGMDGETEGDGASALLASIRRKKASSGLSTLTPVPFQAGPSPMSPWLASTRSLSAKRRATTFCRRRPMRRPMPKYRSKTTAPLRTPCAASSSRA
jgi:hypothetical protein